MLLVGVPLGVLIALITGLITLLVIRQINEVLKVIRATNQIPAKKIQIIMGLLFSIPMCWVGGHWASVAMLESIDFSEMLPSYFTSLASAYMLIIIYPLVSLIIRVANDIGKQ